ncbi:MAG: pyridoxamine 5'-phosphate oxidase family protein [Solirubrobacterales bacterium]
MTASLPQEIRDVFEHFVTCEYTTVDAIGQPITWPVTPYYQQGGESIDVTTGVGYPKKADDAARHPAVSLLFSDPTGSGMHAPARVLVQGIADVDERDLGANRERYWRESAEKLPATVERHPPKVLRGMLDWYYARIYVHVRPERVFVWAGGDSSSEPELFDSHMEEVQSGHMEPSAIEPSPAGADAKRSSRRLMEEEPPEPVPPRADFEPVWDQRMGELAERHETAVVSWHGPDGFPISIRLPVRPDASARRIRLLAEPAGLPLVEGPACLVAHRHPPDFSWQENFQIRGRLVREPEGWALVPRKLIGGFELPDESQLAILRRNFAKARRFRKIYKQRVNRSG